jgi:hypothetical protein
VKAKIINSNQMLTRELLKIVGQLLEFGRSCPEIKATLKRKWDEKDIDEAIWWFEYFVVINKKEINKLYGFPFQADTPACP